MAFWKTCHAELWYMSGTQFAIMVHFQWHCLWIILSDDGSGTEHASMSPDDPELSDFYSSSGSRAKITTFVISPDLFRKQDGRDLLFFQLQQDIFFELSELNKIANIFYPRAWGLLGLEKCLSVGTHVKKISCFCDPMLIPCVYGIYLFWSGALFDESK